MEKHFIKVGIKTKGAPVIYHRGDNFIVENMLIGDNFHWQTTIQAELPGEVIRYSKTKDNKQGELSEDNVTLINIVPFEKYVECVVGSEMNPKAPYEFLKAHAVISRSWAFGKIKAGAVSFQDCCVPQNFEISESCIIGFDDHGSHIEFDVCSDDHCQRYQGIQDIPEINLKAIRETAGEILLDKEGGILDARFSKCCGGVTELFSSCWQNREMPSLESFSDPWCDLRDLSPFKRRTLLASILKDYDQNTQGYGFSWQHVVSKKEIEENLLNKFGRDIGAIHKVEAIERGPSGRISRLRIYGSNATLDIGKELWIRRLLSVSHLYSSAFEIEDKKDSLRLNGIGWGHGVGLCQIGAANMALHGHDYHEILSFYYPGSSTALINQIPD